MRLWLKDSERRPDPLPARTDARKALFAGTLLWLVALGAALIAPWAAPQTLELGAASAAGTGWWLWCTVIGLGLGLGGLVWVQLRRR
ncbi:putative phage tail protein [Cryobacterium sp. CAN_C3]|nr:putative phage tail protein [Cryobacterium sp. CAN_C3]